MAAGADIAVQSTHKMLGSLTQSSMLHLQGERIDRVRLRKKLGQYGDKYIETIFGVGYRFQPYRTPRTFLHVA